MFNMSASMGPKFAETVDEMTERVRQLGPSPLNDGEASAGPELVTSDKTEGETEDDS
jgi:DNA-binding ferritin-like protein